MISNLKSQLTRDFLQPNLENGDKSMCTNSLHSYILFFDMKHLSNFDSFLCYAYKIADANSFLPPVIMPPSALDRLGKSIFVWL